MVVGVGDLRDRKKFLFHSILNDVNTTSSDLCLLRCENECSSFPFSVFIIHLISIIKFYLFWLKYISVLLLSSFGVISGQSELLNEIHLRAIVSIRSHKFFLSLLFEAYY